MSILASFGFSKLGEYPNKCLIGKSFGKLKVIDWIGRDYKSNNHWSCKCICENTTSASTSSLVSGNVTSCGCYLKSKQFYRLGGLSKAKRSEYNSWLEMRRRCNNTTNHKYPDYGGRGITVCEKWQQSFLSFYEDMGDKPSLEYTLDRIDNNKGYSPDNCRWASRSEQQSNKRSNNLLTCFGKTQTITAWSKQTGIHRETIRRRLEMGWTLEKALTQPPRKLKNKNY